MFCVVSCVLLLVCCGVFVFFVVWFVRSVFMFVVCVLCLFVVACLLWCCYVSLVLCRLFLLQFLHCYCVCCLLFFVVCS